MVTGSRGQRARASAGGTSSRTLPNPGNGASNDRRGPRVSRASEAATEIPLDVDELEELERDVEALRRDNRILTLRREKARIQRLNAVLQTSFGNSPSPEGGRPQASIGDDDGDPDGPLQEGALVRTPSEQTLSDDIPYEQPPPRARAPTIYNAKSRREFVEFIRTCELNFDLSPSAYRHEKRKVLWASQYISGKPFDAWNRYKNHADDDDYTWDAFKEVMELALGDPENRGRATWDKYYSARQGPNQTVSAFESYLMGLIDELGDVGPEKAKLERFRSGLRPEIEALVVSNTSRGKNWTDLVSLAISIEERQRGKRNNAAEKTVPRPDRSSPRASPNKRLRSPDNNPTYQLRSIGTSRDLSKVVCYRCKGLGHYANECGLKRTKNPNSEPLGKEKA